MKYEHSGPSSCRQKAEEPGNEKGDRARVGSGAQRRDKSRTGAEARQGMGDQHRRRWLARCLSTVDNK